MKTHLIILLVALLAAGSVHAVEVSAPVDGKKPTSAKTASDNSNQSQNTAFYGGINTNLNTLAQQVKNIKDCNASGTLWNGTGCVTPAGGGKSLVATTAVTTPATMVWGTTASGFSLIMGGNLMMPSGVSCPGAMYNATCSCTAQQNMPRVRSNGTMLFIEPFNCVQHAASVAICNGWNLQSTANTECAKNGF
ncbi:MAG TPA: hypothetical protein VHP58_04360 [Alphaproteobacteria bacterium]|nr:hypothetical protein [Alphaproteobacteria bacterium]